MESSSVPAILVTLADAKALLFSFGAYVGLSLLGATPRVGFVRALTLGWRSGIKSTSPLSVRTNEVKVLNETLDTLQKGQYIAVVGGKGNGKSCLIDTTLNHTFGVVKTSTESGAPKRAIVDQVLMGITGINAPFYNLSANTRRVLFFYSIFFKYPPIVVIRVPERQAGQQYADVTSAVCDLADEYGLRVVVDGSPNSVPPELLKTNREELHSVEPMSKEMIESIPEFDDFIVKLKKHKLDNAVYQVLDGCPAKYMQVQSAIASCPDDAAVDGVKRRLISVLDEAMEEVKDSSPNTKSIIKLFKEKNVLQLPTSDLEAHGLKIDYPNKVFRKVRRVGTFVEPATSAVGLVIRENLVNGQDIVDLLTRL